MIGPHADLAGLAARGLDADEYERARIEAGIPRLGLDLDESTIPQEAWLDRDSVSFTKGCFLGQELVARIDSRGHVNRLLRWLRPSDGAIVLARDAEVEVDGKVVGQVTSAVPGLALGYVRREVDPPAPATVAGTPVTVEPLPGRLAHPNPSVLAPCSHQIRGYMTPKSELGGGDEVGAEDGEPDDEGRAGRRRPGRPTPGRPSPPASSRTIASPMPVPTLRPGTVPRDVEPLEHLGEVGRVDAGTVVAHPQVEVAGAVGRELDDDVRRRVLQRVLHEVRDDLGEPIRVGVGRERGRRPRPASAMPSSVAAGRNASTAVRTCRPRRSDAARARTGGRRAGRGRAGRRRAVRAGGPRSRSRARRGPARRRC